MKNSNCKLKQKLKVGLVIGGAILSLFILGLIILGFLMDPNKYKPFIIGKVAQATGRQLKLDGPVRMSFFPRFEVRLEQISFSNPANWPVAGNLATARAVDVSMSLLSLLTGNVKLNNVTIDGLTLNLIKHKHGNNWTFSSSTDRGSQANSNTSLKLNSFNLTNTRINYQDVSKRTSQASKSFNFSVTTGYWGSVLLAQNNIAVKNAKFDLDDKLKGTLNLVLHEGEYNGHLAIKDLSLPELLDKFDLRFPEGLHKQPFQHLNLATNLHGHANNLALNNFNLQLGASSLTGKLILDSLQPLQLRENLHLDQAELSDFIELNGFKVTIESANLSGNLNANSKMDMASLNAKQFVSIKQLRLLGFDIQQFTAQLNKAIDKMGSLKQLTTSVETRETLNYLRNSIDKLEDKRQKNYAEQTDLGHFTSYILIKNGILTTPNLKLAGPHLVVTNSGSINLKRKLMDYTLNNRLLASKRPTVINAIYFPYNLSGSFSNPSRGLLWASVEKQLITYYATSLTNQPILNKPYNNVKEFFKKVF
ncbi:MAG: AsmA family protein [Burkholderiales bacterium]